jgi:DNA-binding transcriptional ArsR family regulator
VIPLSVIPREAQGAILSSDSEIEAVVRMFKALSDQTRIKALSVLTLSGTYCISDIALMLNMSISRVSHQLSKLENMGFIRRTKSGKKAYYQIIDDCVRSILGTAMAHVRGK